MTAGSRVVAFFAVLLCSSLAVPMVAEPALREFEAIAPANEVRLADDEWQVDAATGVEFRELSSAEYEKSPWNEAEFVVHVFRGYGNLSRMDQGMDVTLALLVGNEVLVVDFSYRQTLITAPGIAHGLGDESPDAQGAENETTHRFTATGANSTIWKSAWKGVGKGLVFKAETEQGHVHIMKESHRLNLEGEVLLSILWVWENLPDPFVDPNAG